MKESVAANVARVLARMHEAALRAHRNPDEIRLVAVSKTIPVSSILEAVEAGVSALGENYIQEALPKIKAVDVPVQWHFIGHLQSNKAHLAVRSFDMIHSVDSFKLAQEISRRALAEGKVMDVLIQVNVSGELSKFGIPPDMLKPLLEKVNVLEGIQVKGLMTMPPFFNQPEQCRPYFRKLKDLARSVAEISIPRVKMDELSMGMSGDFEVAIEEGATLVRVGTAIFGARS
jgi:pyridoxal phosphate enzyme (YggS family)